MRTATAKLLGLGTAVVIGVTAVLSQEKPTAPPTAPARDATIVIPPATALPGVRPLDVDRRPTARPQATADDTELRRLQIARFTLELQEYDAILASNPAAGLLSREVWEQSAALVAAAADVLPPAEAAAWYSWRVALAKQREHLVLNSFKPLPAAETRAAIRNRVKAEIECLEWTRTRVAARDPKVVELAKLELQKLEETDAWNKKLITGGAWDVNTLFNALQVQAVRLQVFHEIYGDSRASVAAFERFVADAEELEAVIRKRFEVGTVRQQELTLTASYTARAKKELEALKARIGTK